jgi:hypothetical protein
MAAPNNNSSKAKHVSDNPELAGSPFLPAKDAIAMQPPEPPKPLFVMPYLMMLPQPTQPQLSATTPSLNHRATSKSPPTPNTLSKPKSSQNTTYHLRPPPQHLHRARATLPLRPEVAHLELEGLRLVDVTPRVLGLDVQVVDGVLVERLGALAREDVREPRRVRQAEDAPSGRKSG